MHHDESHDSPTAVETPVETERWIPLSGFKVSDEREAVRAIEWDKAYGPLIVIFTPCFVYALVRYVVLKGVEPAQIPLYVVNKALSLTAVILISSAYLLGPLTVIKPRVFRKKLAFRKYLGWAGLSVTTLHGIMSLALLNPQYYEKFYRLEGRMTVLGELAILCGASAFLLIAFVGVISISAVKKGMVPAQWRSAQRAGLAALVLVLFHVAAMGARGWVKLETWPGYLPPLTLVAACVIISTFLLRFHVRRKK